MITVQETARAGWACTRREPGFCEGQSYGAAELVVQVLEATDRGRVV